MTTIHESINEWIQIVSERHAIVMFGRSLPKVKDLLYHYTTVDSTLSILESGNVWAGHINFSNDTDELTKCRDLILDTIKSKQLPHGEEAFKKNHVDEKTLDYVWGTIDPFIFSLSKDGDKASQWRAYGAHGYGLSLGFDVSELSGSIGEGSQFAILKIQYDRDNFCKSVLSIVREFDAVIMSNLFDPDGADYFTYKVALHCVLLGLSLSFKTSHHEDEEEYRVLYYEHSDILSDVKLFASPSVLERKFRATGGPLLNVSEFIAPYVEISFDKAFPIRKAFIGPRAGFDRIKQSFGKMPKALHIDVFPSLASVE